MNPMLMLPTSPLADASLSLARASMNDALVDHSVRSFLFARLLAGQDGCRADSAYDEELLFAACVMHDLGLGSLAPGEARFEVEGADLAASLLGEHGVGAADVDRVWEAIALHASMGIANRRDLLTSLTHRGVFVDAGQVSESIAAQVAEVYSAYPRPEGDRSVQDAIVRHASRSATAAPPYSVSAELLRQHQADS